VTAAPPPDRPTAARPAGTPAGTAADRDPFVTTLSVNEFVLVRQAGFHPVELVLGCSVYRLPDDDASRSGDDPGDDASGGGEFVAAAQALYSARQRAMSRLEEEAGRLGADGVVGLRLTTGPAGAQVAPGEDAVEGLGHFTALGTAVRAAAPPAHGTWLNARGAPFTCTLSGQDFWTLLRSGHVPVGVVVGASSYPGADARSRARRGAEDPDAGWAGDDEHAGHTSAVYRARLRALDRLRVEASELQADGVVDLTITGLTGAPRRGRTDVLAIGTAVRDLRTGPAGWPDPAVVLPMGGGGVGSGS